jgi:hypothetical protein
MRLRNRRLSRLKLRRTHNQNWDTGMVECAARRTAKHHPRQATSAMRGHGDEIGVLVQRHASDRRSGPLANVLMPATLTPFVRNLPATSAR